MRKILNLFFAAACAGGIFGCTPNPEEQVIRAYYPNGKLKSVRPVKDGHLHGRLLWLYPDGTMESDSRWLNGKRTGVTRHYYATGVLCDSINFLNDSMNGLALYYAANGRLRCRSYFTNGVTTGRTLLFDSITGKPTEQQIYDPTGQLIYADSYDSHGKPFGRGLHPVVDVKDTLAWGEPYAGSIRFGYPLTGQVKMLVGKLVEHHKAFDRFQLVDTISVVRQSSDGRFYFSYRPARPGADTFAYKFLHTGSRVDSLSVDWLSGSAAFFVKKPKQTPKPFN